VTFRKKAKKVEYNGIEFNSTLELQFALLIEDTCEYMIEPISIWYNKLNLDLRIRSECPHRYIPDFLVRKLKDNSGHLIEIKPYFQVNDKVVQLKKALAERFINEHGYDWKFTIITDRQINLTPEKRRKLDEIKKTRGFLAAKKKMLEREKMFNPNFVMSRNKIPFKTNLGLEERDYMLYLKKGYVPDNEILS
jgi:hypothetical protein